MNPSLVLVQHRKTRPLITERFLMGCKGSNQTKMLSGSSGLQIFENYFSFFSSNTYVVDTQKNRLNEMVSIEHQKHMFG